MGGLSQKVANIVVPSGRTMRYAVKEEDFLLRVSMSERDPALRVLSRSGRTMSYAFEEEDFLWRVGMSGRDPAVRAGMSTAASEKTRNRSRVGQERNPCRVGQERNPCRG